MLRTLIISVFLSINALAVTKIACVGDSITFGLCVRPAPTYPDLLGKLLGAEFEVKNFGNSGKTCGDYAGRWYGNTPQHKEAVQYPADIYICNLGINDTGAWWNEKLFSDGYERLIDQWTHGKKASTLYIWTKLGPDFRGEEGKQGFPGNVFAPTYKYNARDNGSASRRPTAEKLLTKVAQKAKATPIDAYTVMAKLPQHHKDGLHPDPEGARRLAALTFAILAPDLKLEQKQPSVEVDAEQKTISLTNTMTHGLVLDGWRMGIRKDTKTSPQIATFTGTGIVIPPGEMLLIQLNAAENQLEDPTKPMTCTLPASKNILIAPAQKNNIFLAGHFPLHKKKLT